MKKILLFALIYFYPISAQFNPCYDDLYLSLKAKGLNALSTREYHYFTRKDEECSEYNTFDKKYHDQLDEMQSEIYRIAEKLGELDEDINLENISPFVLLSSLSFLNLFELINLLPRYP